MTSTTQRTRFILRLYRPGEEQAFQTRYLLAVNLEAARDILCDALLRADLNPGYSETRNGTCTITVKSHRLVLCYPTETYRYTETIVDALSGTTYVAEPS